MNKNTFYLLIIYISGIVLCSCSSPGRIVYTVEKDGGKDIFARNLDGTDLEQLTKSSSIKYFEPSWSPDRKEIVFSGKKKQIAAIYRMDVKDKMIRKISKDILCCGGPTWSEAGAAIIFFGPSPKEDHYDLYYTEPDKTEILCIAFPGRDATYPSMTFDGKNIFFHSFESENNWDIWKVNVDDCKFVQITKSPVSEWLPACSPDGKVAFWKNTKPGFWQLYLMEQDGTNQEPIGKPLKWIARDGKEWVSRPSWSSDGRLLVSAPNKDTDSLDLMLVDLKTHEMKAITSTPFDEEDPCW